MLVLTRKNGQGLRIGPRVRVQVVAVQGGVVRLAIDAPEDVSIYREEVYQRIAAANLEATDLGPDALRGLRDEEEKEPVKEAQP